MAVAATSDPTSMSLRGATRSARFTTAEATAPTTKPSWTAMVSHDPAVVDRSQRSRSWGSTAEAENQVVIDSTMAVPSTASARQRPGGSAVGEGAVASGPGLAVDPGRAVAA